MFGTGDDEMQNRGGDARDGARSPAGSDADGPVPTPDAVGPTSDPGGVLKGYSPGLDGMRAVGMMAMLGFHAEMPWAKGAFFALSQFFTLSGFLVTTVMLRARGASDRLDLRNFWARRARRLMPAALLGLAVITLFGATVADASQARVLPRQVTGAALYVSNWMFIANDTSYVAQFASPSPVQHYWSLSVEEQFYLLLPLLFVGVLALTPSRRVLAAVLGAVAVASAGWMAFLHSRGASVDRLYYGTDTRLAEMLTGAVLAVVLYRFGRRVTAPAWQALAWIGAAAYAVSLVCFVSVPLEDGFLWQGGMALFSVTTCLAILAILSERGPMRGLAFAPLALVGRLTYGLYIFHLPIFLWLTAERTGLDQWPLFGLRLAVTFAVATASYHLVEMPIRSGRLLSGGRWPAIAVPVVTVVLIAACALTAGGGRTDPLAALAEGSTTVPAAVGDGVIDVLALTEPGGEPLIDALEAEPVEAGQDPLRIVRGGGIECGRIVEEAGGTTCSTWRDTWPDLIERNDPDVVLLFASDVPELAGADPERDPIDLARAVVDSGVDILSARGANVVWAAPALDFFAASDPPTFQKAIDYALNRRADLRRTAPLPMAQGQVVIAGSVPVVRDALELYQRIPDGGRIRIMVIGDSQARSVGFGLEHFYTNGDDAEVWNAAAPGCGIVIDGVSLDLLSDGSGPALPQCVEAVDAWRSGVDRFRPNVVFVLSSLRDMQDRRLPDWSDFKAPGDAQFDGYLLGEYEAATDVLSSRGAKVVWLLPPCVEYVAVLGGDPPPARAYDNGRVAHLRDPILTALAESRPNQVELFDLDGLLCSGGEPLDEIEGISPVRADGVHLTPDASVWLAGVIDREVVARLPR